MTTTRQSKLRVAILTPNQRSASETFIHAHIERLPLEIVPIFGVGWHLFGGRGYLWPYLRFAGAALGKLLPAASASLYATMLGWKLKRFRVDVVLAEYGTTGCDVLGACRRAGIPLVAHFHGFDASHLPTLERYLQAYRELFAEAAGVIAVSTPMRNRLIAWGAIEKKTHLMIYGVDPERFCGAAPATSEPHFVTVGRFIEKKAPYLAVLAFQQVVAAVPTAKLSMIGGGPLLGPTRRLAAALGLKDRVEFLGVQPPDVVSQLMRSARAFVQHSLPAEDGDSEGTPVAIIEAQMTGLPVVSTTHEGIPEVVVDGETGYLVSEGDAIGMGRRMTLLARDPALAGTLGHRARQRALAEFTQEKYLGKLTETIKAAAARKQ